MSCTQEECTSVHDTPEKSDMPAQNVNTSSWPFTVKLTLVSAATVHVWKIPVPKLCKYIDKFVVHKCL